jgi:predicted anti-sigma-YlaC factor YlaD
MHPVPKPERFRRRCRIRRLLCLLLCVDLTGACSVRHYAINRVGDALAASGTSFARDEDPELIRSAAPFSLKLMESVLDQSPNHAPLLTAAARGFTQYAYAYIQQPADEAEPNDVEEARALRLRAQAMYRRARDYGLRALEVRHAGFSAQLRADARAATALLSAPDAQPLYWTAVSWAALVSQSKDSTERIAELPLIDALVHRLRELDPDLDHGALHTFLISYTMGHPGARHPEVEARAEYDQALRLSDRQLASPFVAYAESVCVAIQDRLGFEQSLHQALAVDPQARPDWRLENVVMQHRARWLMQRSDQLFLE